MSREKISEEDQRLLQYSVRRLYERYHTVGDLAKEWLLFGPCIEVCPRPEIRRPWVYGLDLFSES